MSIYIHVTRKIIRLILEASNIRVCALNAPPQPAALRVKQYRYNETSALSKDLLMSKSSQKLEPFHPQYALIGDMDILLRF